MDSRRPAPVEAGAGAPRGSSEAIVNRVQGLLRDQQGATAVEYALMLGAIAAAVIGAVGTLGMGVVGLFESVRWWP